MIEINRDNYEVFAVDYIEGKLEAAESKAFEAFLLLHPDIAEEMEGFDLFAFKNEAIGSDTEDLKKGALLSDSINLDNANQYFVAFHEGDLNEVEKSEVEHFLSKYPEKIQDFNQLKVLRYEADASIQYPYKAKLKKVIPILVLRRALSVAAIFILLFSIAFYLLSPNTPQEYIARKGNVSFPNSNSETIDASFPDMELLVEVPFSAEASKGKPYSAEAPKGEPNSAEASNNEMQGQAERSENVILVGADISEVSDERSEVLTQSEDNSISYEELPPTNDLTVQENPSAAVNEEANKSIISIKRPFKRDKKEKDLLASNDSETLIKFANPLKKRWGKNRSFGPIKVKKGN